MQCWDQWTIRLTIEELEIVAESFEITAISLDDEQMEVTMTIASLDAEAFDFDPEVEEGTEPVDPQDLDPQDTPEPVNFEAHCEQRKLSTGQSVAVLVASWEEDPNYEGKARRLEPQCEYSLADADRWYPMAIAYDHLNSESGPVAERDEAGTLLRYDVQMRWTLPSGTPGNYVVVENIPAVSDAGPPSPPEEVTAEIVGAQVRYGATTGDSANTASIEFRDGASFAGATPLLKRNAGPNQPISKRAALAMGLHRIWAETANGSGVASGAPISASIEVLGGDHDFAADVSSGPALTISGGANGRVQDLAGAWSAGRRSDKGRLIEPASTNVVRNSVAAGAASGSPGAPPTNWSTTNFGGLTRTITVGSGYVDIRWVGTASNTVNRLFFDAGGIAAAAVGEAWSASLDVALVAGSLGPVGSVRLLVAQYNGGGSVLSVLQGPELKASLDATLRRWSAPVTLDQATVASVAPAFLFNMPGNPAVDFTLRFRQPQLEKAAAASSIIETAGAAVTRTADDVSLTLPAGVSTMIFTFDDGSEQSVAVSAGAYAVPTTLNRKQIRRMRFY